MTLPVAAFQLGISYEKAKRLLFMGVLSGRHYEGKWLVSAASITRVREDCAELGQPQSGRMARS